MRIARVASALALTLIAAAPLRGSDRQPTHREQLKQFHDAWVAAGRPWPDAARLEPKFGTDVPEFVNVHAYDFQANTSSDLIMDDGNGYRYFGAPAVPYMAASVQLPSGVAIDSIHLSSCAAHAGDLVLALYDNGTGGSGSGGGTMIGQPVLSGEGCGVTGTGWDPYIYAGALYHPLYVVAYFADGSTDGSTKFNDVTVTYRRQVSPAPPTATFSDVPTTDFGFQHVEALAASAITGGCGNGKYCPDAPVTRRQMAIFLAKALGLVWPQ